MPSARSDGHTPSGSESPGCGSVGEGVAVRGSRVDVARPGSRPSKAAVFTSRGTSTLPIAHSNRAQTPTQKMDGRGAVGGAPEWT
jgi:hypothetical protein